MSLNFRPRRLAFAALTVALVAFVAACGRHPDSVFHSRTDFNREIDSLFKLIIWLGSFVFIFVEGVLVFTLWRFRARPGQREPQHVHGNTTLEIMWTVIPAVILVIIAIPTVRTTFRTEAKARADALQVEVIGHQWWWEFRYPQYGVITANELYLPIGRTVNFTLKSQDVLHSFWIPALGGKRDLITNHTNYLWFTPDSSGVDTFNGYCAEYCGTSHANMRFRTYTVAAADFESWARHEAAPAVGVTAMPGVVPNTQAAVAQNPALAQPVAPTPSQVKPNVNAGGGGRPTGAGPTIPAAGAPGAASAAAPAVQVAQTGFVTFPRERMPAYAVPQTPLPAGLTFDDSLKGDAANGAAMMAKGIGACLGCHTIKGVPTMIGQIGPNLTHIATRNTIGAGLYPNDRTHLVRWVKNAREMKPGIIMPTLGAGQYDPETKATMKQGGLTDQQIADIVAYLETLK